MFPAVSPEAAETAPAAFPLGRDRLLAWTLVLLYAGLQIALFATHEAWRDEAQAWLWAKELSTPREFLFVPGEGHPPLWFWLLRALSSFLNFDQARLLTVATAILNAWLLARVLRADVVLLAAMLGSNVLLQYWGYHFRPYNLVFTALLCALLLDRRQQPVTAAWVLALSCGLHFFSGLPFAMWLLVLLHRKTPLRLLVGPALLAAAFGLTAIISGIGNPVGTPKSGAVMLGRALEILAWPAPPGAPAAIIALVVVLALIYALRKTPFLLASAGTLTLAFVAFGAIVYGTSEWHVAFLMILSFMTVVLAGRQATGWVLPVLLVPQCIIGLGGAWSQLTHPPRAESAIYEAVLADAGPNLNPATQLLAYPDYALSATAARYDLRYKSAMDGTLMGPVHWNTRGTLDPALAATPTPFWLVCMSCRNPLEAIAAAGLRATPLAKGTDADGRTIAGYRIDAGI